MAGVLASARRIVVKVGSSLVTNEGRGVDADAIGVLDLLQRVLDQVVLGVGRPRSWELVFVEDAELHERGSEPRSWNPSSTSARRG